MTNLFATLGKSIKSNEVRALLDLIEPVRIFDDPPFRSYIGSPQQGLDLLIEDDQVRAVQIYARDTSTFRAYDRELPLQIRVGMSQADLNELLGPPLKRSEVSSSYFIPEFSSKITVSFRQSQIWRLTLALI
jgi:hypothetical protein